MTAAAALLLASMLSAAGAGGEHLLAGARHFREGRFGDALVEFRVADKLGADGARSYAAASLVKLERFEEAVEEFEGAPRTDDTLLGYYRALACYGARLYSCADEILTAIGGRGGPRIVAEVAALRGDVSAQRARVPADGDIAWYAARCSELRQPRPALASAYCRETAALNARRAEAPGSAPPHATAPVSTRGARP